jgi:hypothetical protein
MPVMSVHDFGRFIRDFSVPISRSVLISGVEVIAASGLHQRDKIAMTRPGGNIQVTVEPEKIGKQLPSVDLHTSNPTIHAEKNTIVQPQVELKAHVVDPILPHDLPPQPW